MNNVQYQEWFVSWQYTTPQGKHLHGHFFYKSDQGLLPEQALKIAYDIIYAKHSIPHDVVQIISFNRV